MEARAGGGAGAQPPQAPSAFATPARGGSRRVEPVDEPSHAELFPTTVDMDDDDRMFNQSLNRLAKDFSHRVADHQAQIDALATSVHDRLQIAADQDTAYKAGFVPPGDKGPDAFLRSLRRLETQVQAATHTANTTAGDVSSASIRSAGSTASRRPATRADISSASHRLEESMRQIESGKGPLYVPNALHVARSQHDADTHQQAQRQVLLAFKDRLLQLQRSIAEHDQSERRRLAEHHLEQLAPMVIDNLRRRVDSLVKVQQSNAAGALRLTGQQCMTEMAQWVRDLNDRLRRETQANETTLRTTFEQDAAVTLQDFARLAQQETQAAIQALTAALHADREQRLEEIKRHYAEEQRRGIETVRQQLAAAADADLRSLEEALQAQAKAAIEAEKALLLTEYERQQREARATFEATNRQSFAAHRARLEQEHQKALETLAQDALRQSELELHQLRQQLQAEQEEAEQHALADVHAALEQGRHERIAAIRKEAEAQRQQRIASFTTQAQVEEEEALQQARQQEELHTVQELDRLRAEAEHDTQLAVAALRDTMNQRRVAAVSELVARLRQDKLDAEAAAARDEDASNQGKCDELITALRLDIVKAVENVRSAKKIELQRALAQVAYSMEQQAMRAAQDEATKWSNLVAGAEQELAQLDANVSWSASDSDDSDDSDTDSTAHTPSLPSPPETTEAKTLAWIRRVGNFVDALQLKCIQHRKRAIGLARDLVVLRRDCAMRDARIAELEGLVEPSADDSSVRCENCKRLYKVNRELVANLTALENSMTRSQQSALAAIRSPLSSPVRSTMGSS